MAEVLGSGPDRDGPARPGRPPRGRAVAGAVLLAAVAVLLAARAAPDRPVRAAPTPTPRVTIGTLDVAAVAVGTRWLFALAARCGSGAAAECSYELFRQPAGRTGWTGTSLRTTPQVPGGPVQLWVTGEDQVTVLVEPTVGPAYVSPDAGETVAAHRLRPGPPVEVVPADGILDLGLCESCSGRLTVLEPATGLLRPLVTQPPLAGAGPQTLDRAGAVLWVAGRSRTGVVTAVSTDSGRSWLPMPVPESSSGPGPAPDILRLAARPDTSAHLLAGSTDGTSPVLVWAAGPAGPWRRLDRALGPSWLLPSVESRQGLLVGDVAGRIWRLRLDGTFDRESPPVPPAALALIVTGPAGVLLAVPAAEEVEDRVLVSYDEGDSWRVDRLEG